ncbi:YeeE/YedE family integral membrane protein [Histoplasma capsulatum]|uniref:YeeE/YedE family integral membrane protein n=1 Tax=Ajellomyces capsulatus TaxID=5037 RepID=A0A8A1MIZ6_AJECA|nr:YeeE/YedE family integral membrane protein [Histoplasma capsulatum]
MVACPNNQPCYSPTYPTPQQAAFIVGAVMLAQLTNSILVPRMLQKSKNSTTIYSYIAGLQFGLGLFITGMANPAKVLGFFSWFDRSKFDPSLSLVMLFAVIPNLISYMKLGAASGDENGKKRPTLADMFQLPTATMADIDWRFVAGGVAFGVGWGLSGVCPGPGLLRTVLQPKWGLLWMGGYMLGALSEPKRQSKSLPEDLDIHIWTIEYCYVALAQPWTPQGTTLRRLSTQLLASFRHQTIELTSNLQGSASWYEANRNGELGGPRSPRQSISMEM